MAPLGAHIHLAASPRDHSHVRNVEEEQQQQQQQCEVDELALLLAHLLYGAHPLAAAHNILFTVSQGTAGGTESGKGGAVQHSSSTLPHGRRDDAPGLEAAVTGGSRSVLPPPRRPGVKSSTHHPLDEAEDDNDEGAYDQLYHLASILCGAKRLVDVKGEYTAAAAAGTASVPPWLMTMTSNEEASSSSAGGGGDVPVGPYALFEKSFAAVESSLPLACVENDAAVPYFDIIIAVDEESFDRVQDYYRTEASCSRMDRPPVLLLYLLSTAGEPLLWCEAVQQRLEALLLQAGEYHSRWRDNVEMMFQVLAGYNSGVRMALV